jgi:hypothetical protein
MTGPRLPAFARGADQQVLAERIEQIDVVPDRRARRHRQARSHLFREDEVSQLLRLADFVLIARPGHIEASRISDGWFAAVK